MLLWFSQIMNLADAAEENKQRQVEMSSELACMTRIVNLLLRLNQDMSQEDFAMLESCLSPVVDDNAAAVSEFRSVFNISDTPPRFNHCALDSNRWVQSLNPRQKWWVLCHSQNSISETYNFCYSNLFVMHNPWASLLFNKLINIYWQLF